jgi:amino acid transporter
VRPGYGAQVVGTVALVAMLGGLSLVALAAAAQDGRLLHLARVPPPSAMAFLAGVGQAFFLFMGFELVTSHVEVVGSAGPIGTALRRSAAVLTAFYALVALGFAATRPALLAAGPPGSFLTPQLDLATATGGLAAALGVTAACLLASFTSFNGALLALSRLVHALALQGVLPRGLARMDAKRLVPGRALDLLLAASLAASALLEGRALTVLVLGGAAAAATLVYASALCARERPPFREAHRALAWRPLALGLAAALLLLGSGALLDAVAHAR